VDPEYLKGLFGRVVVNNEVRQCARDKTFIEGYVDSNYTGCLDSKKPLIGYVYAITSNWKACL